jgi:hypothetical protein
MILKKVIGIFSLLVAFIGCSNQDPASIVSVNSEPVSTATAATLPSSGLVTFRTSTTTGKYVSFDNVSNLLKANSATVGPLQQFYMEKNSDNTYSIQALSNYKYVNVKDDEVLAVLGSIADNTCKFLFNSASSSDPEKCWINYQNAYRGWLNIGETSIKLGLNQTSYKVVVDKLYGSSANYNSSDYSYTWYGIYLQDSQTGMDFSFYTDGTVPNATTITISSDRMQPATFAYYSGLTVTITSTFNGFSQNNFRVAFNKQNTLSYFNWKPHQ